MAHDTERRQDHDVNLGVPEEPEHVLEQNGVTATGRVKEAGTEVDVHQHHSDHTGQYRNHRNQQIRGDQPRPNEHRHLHQRHAGGTHVEDGRDDVD